MVIAIMIIFWKYMIMFIKYFHFQKRDDNFIAGHSMGGYGTIKFALTQGDKFAKSCTIICCV